MKKIKIFNNNYILCLFLFTFACSVKWFYLACQNYYIVFSDELSFGYNLAMTNSVSDLIRSVICGCSYTLNSARPFLVTSLYALSFKLFKFHVYTAFFLGIFVTSLTVLLYYMIIARCFCKKVALLSFFVLIFMASYIAQSLTVTTIIWGAMIILASFLFALIYYENKDRYSFILLSGLFLSMSIVCRYENAIFLPFFIFYSIFYDKGMTLLKRSLYLFISFSSTIYLFICNFLAHGDPLHFIYDQSANAFADLHSSTGSFFCAFSKSLSMISTIIPWPFWVVGLIQIIFFVKNKNRKALFICLPCIFILFYLFFKITNGTLSCEQKYFFIPVMFFIPLGINTLRPLFNKSRNIAFIILFLIGVMVYFNNQNIKAIGFSYPPALISITQDLKQIPKEDVLYVFPDYNGPLLSGPQVRSLLYYLKRDPIVFSFSRENKPEVIDVSGVFYLLAVKDQAADALRGRPKVLERDYGDVGLYKVFDIGQ